jgi:hypothetical protein
LPARHGTASERRPWGQREARVRATGSRPLIRIRTPSIPNSEYSDEHPDDVLRPADPRWPARVRDAWESFRQARAKVSALIDACDQLQEEQAPRHSVAVVAQHASNGIREADTAYDTYTEQWHAWQLRPETSADHEESEAGS